MFFMCFAIQVSICREFIVGALDHVIAESLVFLGFGKDSEMRGLRDASSLPNLQNHRFHSGSQAGLIKSIDFPCVLEPMASET